MIYGKPETADDDRPKEDQRDDRVNPREEVEDLVLEQRR
jgi:hypothetical protein